jgi:hypothetical protein
VNTPGIDSKREAGGRVLAPNTVTARLVQAAGAAAAGVARGGTAACCRHCFGRKPTLAHASAEGTVYLMEGLKYPAI